MKVCWGAGTCQRLSWLQTEEARYCIAHPHLCGVEMLPAVGAWGATLGGDRERQGFLQAPSFAVITVSVPALCKAALETALGGCWGQQQLGEGAVATKKEW